MKLIVHTDGASRGNPGPSSYGFTIAGEEGKLLLEVGEFIGTTTNNVAEYTAVLKALEAVRVRFNQKTPLRVELFADSKLVAEQLAGRYKIKSQHLKSIIDRIKFLALQLGHITYHHIPRSKNTQADKLANQALDKR